MGKKITAKKENKFSAKRQAFKQSNKEMLDILKQLQQHQRVTVKLKTKPIRKNSQKPSANVEESKTRKEIEQQVVRMMMNVLGKVRYKQIIPQTSTVRVLVQIRLEEALICMFEFFRVKRFENYPRDNFIRGLIHILVGQRKILFTKKVREWVRKQKLGKNERKLLYRKVFAKVMEIRHRSTVALSFLSVVILILQRSTVMVRSDEKNIEICQGIYRLFEEAFSKQFLQKMYYRQTSYTEFEELLQKYKSNILNSFPQFPQQGQFQYYLTCLQNAIKGEFQQKNDNERKRTATDLNKITKESKLSETLEKSDENEQIMVLQLQKKNSYEYLFDQDSKKFRVHQTPFCDQISNNKDNYSNRSE